MVVKVINNIIELNGLILMLLVFGVYLKMTELDSFNFTIE